MHRFFQISTPGLQKRTFINVHFSKTAPRVEISIHHHSFGVRPPFLRGYLYDLILYICSGHVATIMLRIYNLLKIVNILKTCPKKLLSCLWKTTFPISGHLFDTIANNHYAPFRRICRPI